MKTIQELLNSKDLVELEEHLEHYEILVEFFRNKEHTPESLLKEQRLLEDRYEIMKNSHVKIAVINEGK